jgi:co-chaperonin GroES (HSP10)
MASETVTLEPVGSYVVIKPLPQPQVSQIIEVVGNLGERFGRATVTAVGPDVLDLKVGDTVIVSLAAGTNVPGDQLIVPEHTCIAIIT